MIVPPSIVLIVLIILPALAMVLILIGVTPILTLLLGLIKSQHILCLLYCHLARLASCSTVLSST